MCWNWLSFVFVGESLLSRIQGNSDGQSNFNLILQKLSILKNDVSIVIPYLLAKITNNNTGLFFIVAESLFKSYWWLRLSEWLMFDTTKVTINKVRERFCICLLKSNVITAIIVFAWSKLKIVTFLCYLTIRLARHLCSSTPLVYMYVCMEGTYAL